jgi:hypothetical protein
MFYLDVGGHNLEIKSLTTVPATQNLLAWTCTTSRPNLGEIYVTPNESNGPESNGLSNGVILAKFVWGLSNAYALDSRIVVRDFLTLTIRRL